MGLVFGAAGTARITLQPIMGRHAALAEAQYNVTALVARLLRQTMGNLAAIAAQYNVMALATDLVTQGRGKAAEVAAAQFNAVVVAA